MNETRREYSQYFQCKTRANGDKFTCLIDNAPEDLKHLIYEIHNEHFYNCLPNDWIYEIIREAFDNLEDMGYDVDEVNLEADYSYHLLYQWLGNPFAKELCNAAVNEEFCNGRDIYQTISCAQYQAKYLIYMSVNDFIHAEPDHDNNS